MKHCLAGLLVVIAFAADASAQPSLRVSRGWGGKEHSGRWNLVLVRVLDPVPRNVTLQLISPTNAGFASIIEQNITIGPTPATFELYAPAHYAAWNEAVTVLRDASSGKTIAQFPKHIRDLTAHVAAVGPGQVLIGVTGDRALMEQASRDLGFAAGYLPPSQMPRVSIGFDSLDILFLNRADLRGLDREQQQAILDWAGAGGSLIFVPGDNPIPSDSPLKAALPCQIGDVAAVELPPAVLIESHLLRRFSRISSHKLDPKPGSTNLDVIGGSSLTAIRGRFGLGQVLVVPFDLAGLQFEDDTEREGMSNLWKPILSALTMPAASAESRPVSSLYFGYESETAQQQRQGTAMTSLCNFLAPDTSRSERWNGLALAAFAWLFVMGPLDWLALRATGKSGWTWSTIFGWVGLLALVAFFAVNPSAALTPVRVVRVVDQAEDSTVASIDLLATNQVDGISNKDWWQPVLIGNAEPRAAVIQNDLHFHESIGACSPESSGRDGSVQFLQSESEIPGPPVLRASLLLRSSSTGNALAGTIRNMSDIALKDLRIRIAAGVLGVPLDHGLLAPGQEAVVNLPVDKAEPFPASEVKAGQKSSARESLWAIAPDLSGGRSLRIDALLRQDDRFACIYAQAVNPLAPSEFSTNPVPAEYHEWIRAVVPLGR